MTRLLTPRRSSFVPLAAILAILGSCAGRPPEKEEAKAHTAVPATTTASSVTLCIELPTKKGDWSQSALDKIEKEIIDRMRSEWAKTGENPYRFERHLRFSPGKADECEERIVVVYRSPLDSKVFTNNTLGQIRKIIHEQVFPRVLKGEYSKYAPIEPPPETHPTQQYVCRWKTEILTSFSGELEVHYYELQCAEPCDSSHNSCTWVEVAA
jgi:hypothetical protein